jgi:Cu2+-exporting ATPase
MTCCTGTIVADYALSQPDTERIALLDDLAANGRLLPDGHTVYILSAPAIHCGNCISTIERQIGAMDGVKAVRANLSLKRISLTLEPGTAPENGKYLADIVESLAGMGFMPQSLTKEETGYADPELKRLIKALAVAGFATSNIMLLSVPVWNGADGATKALFHFISALIAIPSVAYAGMPFFTSAFSALRHRRMNMDVPISLGVMLATFMSMYESFYGGGHAYFDAAVSLLFFLLIGRTLDHMMRVKARTAATNLVRIAAKGGFVVQDDGSLLYLALEGLKPGMRIRVAAGERIPVDGHVIAGQSDVDRALVTGESAPVAIASGTAVEAGILNLTGSIDIVASREARDSFLAEMTRMMTTAEQGRSHYVRVADRMAKIYAPAVHILSLASFLGWMLLSGGDWHQSVTVAISVLIITCPCALGLAVPVAHIITAGRLFSAGILMKDGSALERMSTITDVFFDKTGTLTSGRPIVTDTTIPTGAPASWAKSLALHSTHPASKALANYFSDLPQTRLSELRETAGAGVEAEINGQKIRLGRMDWVAEIAAGSIKDGLAEGVAFAVEGGPIYTTLLSENTREDAGWAVETMERRNIACTMVSGDGEAPVTRIAARLGFKNFSFNMRPGDKVQAIKTAIAAGKNVLMVGDGLNDAPALAAATVSMAPSTASDVGRATADFVFTRGSLAACIHANDLALATGRIVRQNFGLAIAYNIIAVPLAMAGQLNPLFAAIAMSTSSIIVVGNSMRLYLLKLRSPAVIEAGALRPAPHVKPVAA